MSTQGKWTLVFSMVACVLFTASGLASDFELAKSLMKDEKYKEAVDALKQEVARNPGHEAAYLMLIDALERNHQPDAAAEVCREVMKISRNEKTLDAVRQTLIRLTRTRLDEQVHNVMGKTELEDHLRIKLPPIDTEQWKRLEKVENATYRPDPELGLNVPPITYETQHFRVYACNEELAELVAKNAEIYLDFMSKRLFGGREWAFRLPILIYKDEADYISVGHAPAGSHGVAAPDFFGRTELIRLFQLLEIQKPDGGRETVMYKYAIESILYHELTHAILFEFFGLETPQWLHEAVAGRMEQTRAHYEEAARLARAVVAGEHFRLRDLFDQEGYPARISLFYETAAIVVLFLFEAGDEAMYTFLNELAKHPKKERHDAACAAVFGIPKEGAVEEFEKRWVQWMTRRYVKDLQKDEQEKDTILVGPSNDAIFRPLVGELETFTALSDWREVNLNSMAGFAPVSGSKDDWTTVGGRLRCNVPKGETSFLGIRMKETAPLVVECEVKWTGPAAEGGGWVGFNQFNADKLDTSVNVMTKLTGGDTHSLYCMLADELVLYVDGKLVSRQPAFVPDRDSRDIDFPLAIVTESPIEISKLRVASIKRFAGVTEPPKEGEQPPTSEGGHP